MFWISNCSLSDCWIDTVGATLAVARNVSMSKAADFTAQSRQVVGDRKGRPYG